jgi:hypothetical protein
MLPGKQKIIEEELKGIATSPLKFGIEMSMPRSALYSHQASPWNPLLPLNAATKFYLIAQARETKGLKAWKINGIFSKLNPDCFGSSTSNPTWMIYCLLRAIFHCSGLKFKDFPRFFQGSIASLTTILVVYALGAALQEMDRDPPH